jgi:16S rRNA U516 pseudouridylate synthase RsuA-like enzyme
MLMGKKTLPCQIKYKHNKNHAVITITLKEGRNRQVKKMFEKFGYFVQKLHRAKYGNVPIGNIKIGTWRYLETKEINDLKNLLNKEIRENREYSFIQIFSLRRKGTHSLICRT